MSRLLAALAAVPILILLCAGAVRAGDEDQHPLVILRAEYSQEAGSTAGPSRGKGTLWLRNLADVKVDGIKVEILMRSPSGRVRQKIVKEVGEIEAGKRAYVDWTWEDYSGETLRPEFWVLYNGGGQEPVRFQAEPPVW
ncbi:MAG TPA: hypothetical protein VNO81_14450 [Candidatus Nitrosotenuis sp.]|nr:hypothetical protein [Candidatus Nitrosotenuis sp.]